MGKKGAWFSSVKKALSPQSKNNQKTKSKRRLSGENKNLEAVPQSEPINVVPPPPLVQHVVKSTEIDVDDEQNKHAYSVEVAAAAAAEAAVAAAEVTRLTAIPRFAGKSKEEIAAMKIQTAFRGYMARRALRALRGLVRLKSLIEGQSVKRQVETTLRCMQTLARVQSQIQARRIRMSEENQALQRQLLQKHEKELEKLRMGEWDDSTQSKEQIEASLQSKQLAAMRRERALAYAFTHQKPRKNSKHSNPTFMDPNNPQWGWSWLERWMAVRPWESRSMTEKDHNDHSLVKSAHTFSVAGEINRAYTLRDLILDSNKSSPTAQKSSRPPSRQSPSTPGRVSSSNPGSAKSRQGKPKANGWSQTQDDDARSTMSVQSQRYRRHSIAESSVRDDESLANSPGVPSYMVPKKSVKAKNKPPSPLGVVEQNGSPLSDQKPPFVGSAKKRLSFSASPGVQRRHSVPGKVESTRVKGVPVEIVV